MQRTESPSPLVGEGCQYGTGILLSCGSLRNFAAYAAHGIALSPRPPSLKLRRVRKIDVVRRSLGVGGWERAASMELEFCSAAGEGVLLQRISAFGAVEAAVGRERARI